MVSEDATSSSQTWVAFCRSIGVKLVESEGKGLPSNMEDLTLVLDGQGGKDVKYILGCGLYFFYYMLGDKGPAFHDKLVTG